MIIYQGTSHMLGLVQRHAIDGRVDQVKITDDSRFWSLTKALRTKNSVDLKTLLRNPLLAIDPGETTGIAIWDPSSSVILLTQLDTSHIGQGFDALWAIINYMSLDKPRLQHVRYEDYRVYGHMTNQHAFSHLHTARVIGAIEVACHLAQVPSSCALAVHAKAFWTDEKLEMCGLYNKGLKHARDAERHLLRYMAEM